MIDRPDGTVLIMNWANGHCLNAAVECIDVNLRTRVPSNEDAAAKDALTVIRSLMSQIVSMPTIGSIGWAYIMMALGKRIRDSRGWVHFMGPDGSIRHVTGNQVYLTEYFSLIGHGPFKVEGEDPQPGDAMSRDEAIGQAIDSLRKVRDANYRDAGIALRAAVDEVIRLHHSAGE